MRKTISVTGSKEHLEQLASTLREKRIEGIEISDPRAAKDTLLSREPLGQFGLFEIMISVAANLASSAVYDGIKQIIDRLAQDGKVKVANAPKSPAESKLHSGHGSTIADAKSKASTRRPKK